jgi:hypothetical protein
MNIETSAEKAMSIIRTLLASKDEVTVSQISAAWGCSPTYPYRVLNFLVQQGRIVAFKKTISGSERRFFKLPKIATEIIKASVSLGKESEAPKTIEEAALELAMVLKRSTWKTDKSESAFLNEVSIITQEIGNQPLHLVSEMHIKALRHKFKGLSANTLSTREATLRRIMAYAESKGYVDKNPLMTKGHRAPRIGQGKRLRSSNIDVSTNKVTEIEAVEPDEALLKLQTLSKTMSLIKNLQEEHRDTLKNIANFMGLLVDIMSSQNDEDVVTELRIMNTHLNDIRESSRKNPDTKKLPWWKLWGKNSSPPPLF